MAMGNQELADKDVHYEEDYIQRRGLKLFTCRWLPVHQEIKGLIFMCHGYGVECSVFLRPTGIRFAQAGYAAFGIDQVGHGKSEGRRCYVESFQDLVDDSIAYFKSIRDLEEYRNKPRFLYGESMGGAIVLHIHRKEPEEWSGAVLQAPMCKISEKLKPPQIVTSILTMMSNYIPTWKIVPSENIIDNAFKDPIKRAEVILPFLLLHGEEDRVTDPDISRELFRTSKSCDKEFKLYPGMWHGLTAGEPDDNVELVFNDIIHWLNKRSSLGSDSPLRQADISALESATPSKQRSSSDIKATVGKVTD
uniref:Serine aminopeptidase S33 domain-containing protein n=1 Tax=Physcomitrium patens TaxID=3218 RepID=A0A7I4A5L0_PHYPA